MSQTKIQLAVILAFAAAVLACSVPAERNVTPSPTALATYSPTLVATITPTATATPTSTPTPTATPTPAIDRSVPPERDLYSLAQRLVLKSQTSIPRVTTFDPAEYKEGRKDRFNVMDFQATRAYQVSATLHLVTEHAYWYVDDNVSFDVAALKESARVFEEQIRPRITQVLGGDKARGTSSGARLTILHTPLGGGVAGYYSSTDQYPVQVQPYSNQREMLYLDTPDLALGSRSYLGTLAHEFTHAVQFTADPTEETWISEGLAEFGRRLGGYPPAFHSAFLAAPSVSLTVWPDVLGGSAAYYGAASLFMDYLADRFGTQSLRVLLEEAANGIQGVNAYLAKAGVAKGFRDVFADWIVANYLNDRGGGVFGYPSLDTPVSVSQTVSAPGKVSGQVPQYGAGYYDLRLKAPRVTVVFQGQKDVPLFPQDPPNAGGCWWSNGGDSIDTTLTRRFQLPSANPLTLEYSLWYSLENGWDYTYVEISLDNGITWDILKGGHTSLKDDNINAFGPGYTGNSGGWLQDRVDLTPYAGKEALLRFEYVTDESIHGPGLCVTDIAIPEAGFSNKADQDKGAWDALGFLWTTNRVPQNYILRVIEVGAAPLVRDIPLDENLASTITIEGLGTRIENAVIVVAGVADYTTLPASFQLEVVVSQGS